MKTAPSKQAAPSPKNDPGESIAALRIAVNEMDGYACTAFNEIHAVASLVLVALESPQHCNDTSTMAHALGIIKARAEEAANAINCSAEAVGWNHVDRARGRRADAMLAAVAGATA